MAMFAIGNSCSKADRKYIHLLPPECDRQFDHHTFLCLFNFIHYYILKIRMKRFLVFGIPLKFGSMCFMFWKAILLGISHRACEEMQ